MLLLQSSATSRAIQARPVGSRPLLAEAFEKMLNPVVLDATLPGQNGRRVAVGMDDQEILCGAWCFVAEWIPCSARLTCC
jgi:hypothetical protein